MFEMDQTQATSGQEALVKDVTEMTFMQDVVEASMQVPVIVDFWAPWCGPCKTLGPALEAAVTEASGRVKMAKIDVDQNQQIAAQMRIQSIPTVYAFWQGQPIDGFQGALPASELKAFVERVAEHGGPADDGGLAAAVEAAEQMLEAEEFDDAAQTFAAVLEEEPDNAAALFGLVRALLAQGMVQEAKAALEAASDVVRETPDFQAASAQLLLAEQAQEAGPIAELEAELEQDPSNLQVQFDLAQALHSAGETERAVNTLLELFRKDREWNEGAAKAQLFTIFDALSPKDPIALAGRRKLSSIIFA